MLVVFSLSDVERCEKRNDAESISHCLCYARTLALSSRVDSVQYCNFLQILLKERGGGKNTVLALKFTN